MNGNSEKDQAMRNSLIAIGIMSGGLIVAQGVSALLDIFGVSAGVGNILAGVIYVLSVLLLTYAVFAKWMKQDLSDLGICRFSLKMKWVLTALGLPSAVVACYLLFVPGEYAVTEMSFSQKFGILAEGVFFTGIGSGFVEEIIFRGIIMHSLEKAWNRKAAVIVPSVVFGLIHVLDMGYSLESTVLVIVAGTLVGIMFSLIAIESGSIWCSGLVHSLWNIIVIGGGIAIAPQQNNNSIVTYVLKSESLALTGGEFGIESSVVAMLGYVIVIIIAYILISEKEAEKNSK